jgi:hypothetical protein
MREDIFVRVYQLQPILPENRNTLIWACGVVKPAL